MVRTIIEATAATGARIAATRGSLFAVVLLLDQSLNPSRIISLHPARKEDEVIGDRWNDWLGRSLHTMG